MKKQLPKFQFYALISSTCLLVLILTFLVASIFSTSSFKLVMINLFMDTHNKYLIKHLGLLYCDELYETEKDVFYVDLKADLYEALDDYPNALEYKKMFVKDSVTLHNLKNAMLHLREISLGSKRVKETSFSSIFSMIDLARLFKKTNQDDSSKYYYNLSSACLGKIIFTNEYRKIDELEGLSMTYVNCLMFSDLSNETIGNQLMQLKETYPNIHESVKLSNINLNNIHNYIKEYKETHCINMD